MKYPSYVLVILMLFTLSSCGSSSDKSKSENDQTQSEKPIISTSTKKPVLENDTIDANTVIDNREEKDPDPNDFISVEKEPIPTNIDEIKKAIGYPTIARDAGIEGNVVVRILVGKDGEYKNHVILNQVHPILSDAVELQVKYITFTPAMNEGKPVAHWVNLPFPFKSLP